MTILPTKRPCSSNEEEKDSPQNENAERNVRRREDIVPISLNEATASRRSPFSFSSSTPQRRPRDCERKRDRIVKGGNVSEPLLENSAGSVTVDSVTSETSKTNEEAEKEDCSGFNSEDEYDYQKIVGASQLTGEEWQKRDDYFSRCMCSLGFEINQMNEDGACLFRSIADQVYGDQEFHDQVRQDCMNYIVKNRDYFQPYIIEDFDKYVARKRKWNVHGNHLEIQAMSELYNRTVEVYCYQKEPIYTFSCSSVNSYEPIRLSYHRMCHYNSISNPSKPSVGVGLGLPNYNPVDIDRKQLHDAVRASEQLLIEQTMLEDKIKATFWEATNEAIEEQVARESYIQYCRDAEQRLNSLAGSSSSTVTCDIRNSPRSSRQGSLSPKACQSSKGCLSPKKTASPVASPRASLGTAPTKVALGDLSERIDHVPVPPPCVPTEEELIFDIEMYNSPKIADTFKAEDFGCNFLASTEEAGASNVNDGGGFGDFNQGIMAQVLRESQKTYLDELLKKQKSKKCNTSPGPSTSA